MSTRQEVGPAEVLDLLAEELAIPGTRLSDRRALAYCAHLRRGYVVHEVRLDGSPLARYRSWCAGGATPLPEGGSAPPSRDHCRVLDAPELARVLADAARSSGGAGAEAWTALWVAHPGARPLALDVAASSPAGAAAAAMGRIARRPAEGRLVVYGPGPTTVWRPDAGGSAAATGEHPSEVVQ